MVGQLIMWAITIVVIRMLNPEDYGLMAISVLFINFLMLINELGLDTVLIHKANLDLDRKRQIFGLIILINTVFFILLYLAAPWIAIFFEDGELTLIIRVLSAQFLISAFLIVPVAHLERNLEYKTKSLIYVGSSIVGGIITLLLAMQGYGVWALVWGNLVVVTLQTIGVNIASPFRHAPKFSLTNMREVISFGGLVTLERAMWFFYTQADIFIVGKLLGKDLLGIYSVAMHLASIVLSKTGALIYEIAFPSFSRANEEAGKVAIYFRKAVRIMSFVIFPIFFGMSSVAPELVAVFLGDTWTMVGPVLAILCIVMPLRMMANLFPPVLQGIGRPELSVLNLAIASIVMPLAFLVGTIWGVIGVSLAWVLVYPIVFAIMLRRSVALLGIRAREILGIMAMPAFVSAIMYMAVIAVKSVLDVGGDYVQATRLTISIVVGAVLYSSISYLFLRDGFRDILELVKR
jgi:O-antigen/teichoic acid export membrane protein